MFLNHTRASPTMASPCEEKRNVQNYYIYYENLKALSPIYLYIHFKLERKICFAELLKL